MPPFRHKSRDKTFSTIQNTMKRDRLTTAMWWQRSLRSVPTHSAYASFRWSFCELLTAHSNTNTPSLFRLRDCQISIAVEFADYNLLLEKHPTFRVRDMQPDT